MKIKKLIPKRLKAKLRSIILSKVDYVANAEDTLFLQNKHSNLLSVSYSQQGEDLAIERYFQNKKEGLYVEVGAFHPILYSNSFKFYQQGWHGINIEANADNIEQFKIVRPKDINLNVAVGSSDVPLPYYKFNAPALNSFSEAHKDIWEAKKDFFLVDTIQVEQKKLKDLLAIHLGDRNIDFMSIDVEGLDLAVLRTNDWEIYRPELILVEDAICDLKCFADSEIFNFLNGKSYRLHEVCGGTCLYKNVLKKDTD